MVPQRTVTIITTITRMGKGTSLTVRLDRDVYDTAAVAPGRATHLTEGTHPYDFYHG